MGQCCAYNCKETGIHRFPKNVQLRNRWEFAVSRKKFISTKYSRLCQKHFKPEDYKVERSYNGGDRERKRLKEGVIPSVFDWKTKPATKPKSDEREQRINDRAVKRNLFSSLSVNPQDQGDSVACVMDGDPDHGTQTADVEYVCDEFPVNIGCVEETIECPKNDGKFKEKAEHSAVGSESEGQAIVNGPVFFNISAQSFKNDDKGIHFYTGLECFSKFMLVYHTLCPEAERLKYRNGPVGILPEDAFLLTLIKLRRNKARFELHRMFGLSERQVTNVIFTWISFMSQMWSMIELWPSRELIDFFMPEGFKIFYPSTRVIVDATEIAIEKPSQPAAQQATFSYYKNKNTLKIEVGGSPSGLISHVSACYGGATSDRQLVERSGLIQKCEEGDSVMADRGFNVTTVNPL